MTPERWQLINRLFESALRRDTHERAAFLAQACEGDEGLRREVESLLDSHERAGGFLEESAIAAAAKQSAGGDGQLPTRAPMIHLLGPSSGMKTSRRL